MTRNLFDLGEVEAILDPLVLLFPTNQMNLQELLSSGLLKPREGFPENKYYEDVLRYCPGRLPLFIGRVPFEALEAATTESDFLTPVVLEIEGSFLKGGPVECLDQAGGPHSISLPLENQGRPSVLLWPGVLPVSLVKNIWFSEKSHRDSFQREAGQVSNVSPEMCRLRTEKGFQKLISKSKVRVTTRLQHIPSVEPTAQWPDFLRTEAVGGVMAHLYQACANASDISRLPGHVYGSPPMDLPPEVELPSFLHDLPAWMNDFGRSRDTEPKARLFIELLDLLSTRQAKEDPPTKSLVRVLENQAAQMDEKVKSRFLPLVQRINHMAAFGDESPESFFDQSGSPVLNGLYLFLLKGNSRELLESGNDFLFKDLDFLAARLLCGAWEGWTGLATKDRGKIEFQKAVCHFMADRHNRRFGLTVELAPTPELPEPPLGLHALFGNADWDQKAVQNLAVDISRKMSWPCIRTLIAIPAGEYTLKVGGGSVKLHIDRDVQPLHRVVPEDFMAFLKRDQGRVPDELVRKTGKLLGRGA